MKIILGSRSPHKLDALRQACVTLGLKATAVGVETSSGQNEQPVGFDETFAGALTRATSAREQKPCDISIGIESGIFRISGETPLTLDIAVVVILTKDGRQIVTTSEAVQFPEEYVDIAEERGFNNTTVGSIITEKVGGDPTDPHATLTKGTVTRTATLTKALVTALQQV